MRKNTKKMMSILLIFLLVLSAVCLVGCDDGSKPNDITVEALVPPTYNSAVVGENVKLIPVSIKDSKGNIYNAVITVKKPNGDDVIISGDVFVAETVGTYIVTYTVTVGATKYVKDAVVVVAINIESLKVTAKKGLNDFFATKIESDYSAQNWQALAKIVEDGLKAIDLETTANGISDKLKQLKENIESIKKLVTISYIASDGGTINGVAVQKINQGETSSSVTATPNAGFVFSRWSDGSEIATRTDVVNQQISITANFLKIANVVVNEITSGVTYGDNVVLLNAHANPTAGSIVLDNPILKVGRFEYSYTFTPTDVKYAVYAGKVFITVGKASQADFSITQILPQTIDTDLTKNNFIIETVGAKDSATITYSIIDSGTSGATISGNTVTFATRGTIKVSATVAESKNYLSKTVEISVEILGSLADIKNDAQSELNDYVLLLSELNYYTNEWSQIQDKKTNNAITSAINNAEVEKALADAKQFVDNVMTKTEKDLYDAKQSAITSLNSFRKESNYAVNVWSLYNTALNKHIVNINAVTEASAIQAIINTAKNELIAFAPNKFDNPLENSANWETPWEGEIYVSSDVNEYNSETNINSLSYKGNDWRWSHFKATSEHFTANKNYFVEFFIKTETKAMFDSFEMMLNNSGATPPEVYNTGINAEHREIIEKTFVENGWSKIKYLFKTYEGEKLSLQICSTQGTNNLFIIDGIIITEKLKSASVVNPIVDTNGLKFGAELPTISLTTGDTAGTITWDQNQTVVVGIKNYAWTFIPTKLDEFFIKTGTISLTATKGLQKNLVLADFGTHSMDDVDKTITLSVSGGSGSGLITFAINANNTANATIANNVITFTAAGTITVTITKAADENYESAELLKVIVIAANLAESKLTAKESLNRFVTDLGVNNYSAPKWTDIQAIVTSDTTIDNAASINDVNLALNALKTTILAVKTLFDEYVDSHKLALSVFEADKFAEGSPNYIAYQAVIQKFATDTSNINKAQSFDVKCSEVDRLFVAAKLEIRKLMPADNKYEDASKWTVADFLTKSSVVNDYSNNISGNNAIKVDMEGWGSLTYNGEMNFVVGSTYYISMYVKTTLNTAAAANSIYIKVNGAAAVQPIVVGYQSVTGWILTNFSITATAPAAGKNSLIVEIDNGATIHYIDNINISTTIDNTINNIDFKQKENCDKIINTNTASILSYDAVYGAKIQIADTKFSERYVSVLMSGLHDMSNVTSIGFNISAKEGIWGETAIYANIKIYDNAGKAKNVWIDIFGNTIKTVSLDCSGIDMSKIVAITLEIEPISSGNYSSPDLDITGRYIAIEQIIFNKKAV